MRVLVISNIFPPDFIGGYELMASEIANAFANLGHEVVVATSPLMSTLGPEVNGNFRIERSLHCGPLSVEPGQGDQYSQGVLINLHNIEVLNNTLIRFEPEFIYCLNIAGLGSIGLVWFLVKSGITPVVHLGDNVFSHQDEAVRQGDFNRFKSYLGFDGIVDRIFWIAVSNLVLQETARTINIPITNVTYVPAWNYESDSLGVRPKRTPHNGITRFVFASRIAPHKGIHLLLDAVKGLLDRGAADFTVDVYGNGETPEWMNRASALNLDTHVSFKGIIPKARLLEAFAEYDALLLPTWERDPCPTVIGMAASKGCIPITTLNGAAEWLLDGEDCIKIRRDASAIAAAMLRIMCMDSSLRCEFANRLCRKARLLYSFESWFPMIEQIAQTSKRIDSFDPARQRQIFGATTGLVRLWRG